ncbi:transcription activator, effector binding domain protein [sediment metagenome]|uniref:Transcription activator, effector binding domain protein n=1 Tax=sediment metagenome TaxID=749907 RepID=D9PLJ5_9ZZZZ
MKGGTNSDGSRNAEYCSLCYENGQFKQANFTAQQMQYFCLEKLREQGMLKPFAWLLTRHIPKLKRWQHA